MFTRLGRPPSMSGVERISNQEIVAYESLYRVKLTRWELDTLAMLDSIALEILNKQTGKK